MQTKPLNWLADDTGRAGELLFSHTILTYVAFLLVPVFYWLITKTTFGLNVRAVGENPQAADTLGVSVNGIRTVAIVIGNTMAGLAGAALALEIGIFQQNLTAGRGFIAIALVYFGAWRPVGVMAGSLLFGIVSSAVLRLQVEGIISGSVASISNMAPAVLTVIVLVVVSRAHRPTSGPHPALHPRRLTPSSPFLAGKTNTRTVGPCWRVTGRSSG